MKHTDTESLLSGCQHPQNDRPLRRLSGGADGAIVLCGGAGRRLFAGPENVGGWLDLQTVDAVVPLNTQDQSEVIVLFFGHTMVDEGLYVSSIFQAAKGDIFPYTVWMKATASQQKELSLCNGPLDHSPARQQQ